MHKSFQSSVWSLKEPLISPNFVELHHQYKLAGEKKHPKPEDDTGPTQTDYSMHVQTVKWIVGSQSYKLTFDVTGCNGPERLSSKRLRTDKNTRWFLALSHPVSLIATGELHTKTYNGCSARGIQTLSWHLQTTPTSFNLKQLFGGKSEKIQLIMHLQFISKPKFEELLSTKVLLRLSTHVQKESTPKY